MCDRLTADPVVSRERPTNVIGGVRSKKDRAHHTIESTSARVKRLVAIAIRSVNASNVVVPKNATIFCELSADYDSPRAIRPDDGEHRFTRACRGIEKTGRRQERGVNGARRSELYEMLRPAVGAERKKRTTSKNVAGRILRQSIDS